MIQTRHVLTTLAAFWLLTQSANAAEPISLVSLLRELPDTEAIARWPANEYTCHQASSYDRARVAPDKPGWFANNDHTQYIRKEIHEGRTEHVLMVAVGPGAIVRFWMTAGGKRDGVLRVYLDDAPKPTLTFRSFDLLDEDWKTAAPIAQPHPGSDRNTAGSTLYLPIPYAKSCKVTWEEGSGGARYYVINYRTYAKGANVQTLTREHLTAAGDQIDRVNEQLAAPPQYAAGRVTSLNATVPAGGEKSVQLPAGGAAVRRVELRLEAGGRRAAERALRGVIVKMTFDGEPTVWCPASDFFGSGVGINELNSWYRTVTKDGSMSCRWVMPYRTSAEVSLQNVGGTPVEAALHVTTGEWAWDDRSMHFHTAWHHESGLKTPPYRDWNFATLTGRGVYVGDVLSLVNPVPTWYGEGNEKIWVDGESFPSHIGTGTEDYYGYSYAPRGLFQSPFANQVRVDQPMTQGHNVLTRTRNLDGIPFRKSLQFDMELMSWTPTTLTYAATVYWYAVPGGSVNVRPQPAAAAAPVPTLAELVAARGARVPGAVECETLKILVQSDGISVGPQDMAPWDAARWSGGAHLVVKVTKPGQFVELAVPATGDRPAEIVLHATGAPDFGTLKFTVNGRAADATLDAYRDRVEPLPPLTLGTFVPKDGRFVVRVEVTGANPKSAGPRFFFGLDCFVINRPDDIVVNDFEGRDYGDWKTTGTAFGTGPAQGALKDQAPVTGFKGHGLVNTFLGGDESTGTLTSPAFAIDRRYIGFVIGGGKDAEKLAVQLVVDGKVVRTATGPGGSEALAPAFWEVGDFAGRKAVIKIIDATTGAGGHITVDHIVQTDRKPDGEWKGAKREPESR